MNWPIRIVFLGKIYNQNKSQDHDFCRVLKFSALLVRGKQAREKRGKFIEKLWSGKFLYYIFHLSCSSWLEVKVVINKCLVVHLNDFINENSSKKCVIRTKLPSCILSVRYMKNKPNEELYTLRPALYTWDNRESECKQI